MCGSWDWADNEQERQNNFVHTALLQRWLRDAGAAESDPLVHLQLRGSALERLGWLLGHKLGGAQRVERHSLVFTATLFCDEFL